MQGKQSKILGSMSRFLERIAQQYLNSFPAQLFVLTIGIFSAIYFVMTTYDIPSSYEIDLIVESIVFVVFVIDFLLQLSVPSSPYPFSFQGIADTLSMFPFISIFFEGKAVYNSLHTFNWLGFLKFFRLTKILPFFEAERTYKFGEVRDHDHVSVQVSQVTYQVVRLVVIIITFIFMSSGAVFALSANSEHGAFAFEWDERDHLTFLQSLYFCVVTIATVGYGDITPRTGRAQALTIVIIVLSFGIIPSMLANVFSALVNSPRYAGSYRVPFGHKHVCLCGIVDYELLNRFLTEYFHETHRPPHLTDIKTNVVILSPTRPTQRVKLYINSLYENKVCFLMGSAKSFQDLRRIKAHKALAIYLVGDQMTSSLRVEEDSVLLSAMSVRKYLEEERWINKSKGVKITKKKAAASLEGESLARMYKCMTLVKLSASARCKAVLKDAGCDVVLDYQEMRYSLLGLSAVFPGLLALFINLNRARSVSQQRMATRIKKTTSTTTSRTKPSSIWQKEYFEGSRYCIQQISLSSTQLRSNNTLQQLTFKQAVDFLYRSSKGEVILIAAIVTSESKEDLVIINPCKLNLRICDYVQQVLVISKTYEIALDCLARCYDESESGMGGQYGYGGGGASAEETMWDAYKNIPYYLSRSKSSATPLVSVLGDESPRRTQSAASLASQHRQQVQGLQEQEQVRSGLDYEYEPTFSIKKLSSFINSYGVAPPPPLSPSIALPLSHSSPRTRLSLLPSRLYPPPLKLEPLIRSDGFGGGKDVDLTDPLADKLSGHIVLIYSSSGSPGELNANALFLPVLYFIRRVRETTNDHIVVLSERAEEFIELATEVATYNPQVHSCVHFFSGVPRNLDHLALCHVDRARVVIIIRPPTAAECSDEGIDASRAASINRDRHTIIVSLSLHLLLRQSSMRRMKEGGIQKRATMVIAEVIHESNVSFLRNRGRSLVTLQGQSPSGDQAESEVEEGGEIFAEDLFDWQLIASGSVISPASFDSLMAQCVFNKCIIFFWENLLGVGSSQRRKAAILMQQQQQEQKQQQQHQRQQQQQQKEQEQREQQEEQEEQEEPELMWDSSPREKFEEKSIQGGDRSRVEDSTSLAFQRSQMEKQRLSRAFQYHVPKSINLDDFESKDDDLSDEHGVDIGDLADEADDMDRARDEGASSQGGQSRAGVTQLEKVDMPRFLIGGTYNDVFHFFHRRFGAIPIALHRWPSLNDPYVLVSPSPYLKVEENDEVFLIMGDGVIPDIPSAAL